MKSVPPRSTRPKTSSSGRQRRRRRRLLLSLSLVCATLALTASAAATCNFLLKWGTSGTGAGQFTTPRGIAVDGAGNVYVPDQFTRVQKFDSGGNFILQFGAPGDIPGGF